MSNWQIVSVAIWVIVFRAAFYLGVIYIGTRVVQCAWTG